MMKEPERVDDMSAAVTRQLLEMVPINNPYRQVVDDLIATDPARLAGAWVLTDGSRLVGYSQLRRGTGQRLLLDVITIGTDESGEVTEALVHCAHRAATEPIDWWVREPNGAVGARIARESRFAKQRRVLRMELTGIEAALDNADFAEVRSLLPSEAKAFIELNNQAFAEHDDRSSWTVDDFQTTMDELGNHYEDVLVTRTREGGLSGFCWTKQLPRPLGEIYVLAVAPNQRGTGLARRLLNCGIRHVSESYDTTTIVLYVEHDNERAIRLYENVGFHDVGQSMSCYEIGPAPIDAPTQ